jgi:hypothetical protein
MSSARSAAPLQQAVHEVSWLEPQATAEERKGDIALPCASGKKEDSD